MAPMDQLTAEDYYVLLGISRNATEQEINKGMRQTMHTHTSCMCSCQHASSPCSASATCARRVTPPFAKRLPRGVRTRVQPTRSWPSSTTPTRTRVRRS
jgi:hypothetical protein